MFPGTERGIGGGMSQAVAAKPSGLTREAFIHAVRELAVNHAVAAGRISSDEAHDLLAAKLVYGLGTGAYRGVCASNGWNERHAFIEIAATGEENTVQLAGTTVHETGHALAGFGAGHGKEWKAACARLGLIDALAVGHVYTPDGFDSALWASIAALGEPSDGRPTFGHLGGLTPRKPGACPAGRGTRGGKSRGVGSGSRLRLWQCGCGVKVRVASDDFRAHCDKCGGAFEYQGK